MDGERYPQTRRRRLSAEEVAAWSDEELRYALNEMVARRGFAFGSSWGPKFEPFAWYQPIEGRSEAQSEALFSADEKGNHRLLMGERDRRLARQQRARREARQAREEARRREQLEASRLEAGSEEEGEPGGEVAFQTYRDDLHGWSLEHPVGWSVSRKTYEDGRERVEIVGPSPEVRIVVDVSPGQASDAEEDWRSLHERFSRTYGSRYSLISLSPGTLGPLAASRWEFTMRKSGEPLLHKIDYGTSHNGDGYAMLLAAPAEQFEAWRSAFDRAYLSFRLRD